MPELQDKDAPNAALLDDLVLISKCFQKGISRSALLAPTTGPLDAHDSKTAIAHNGEVEKIVSQIGAVFEFLKNTPFDGARSLLDVTTVVVTSEFGRTMRQTYVEDFKDLVLITTRFQTAC